LLHLFLAFVSSAFVSANFDSANFVSAAFAPQLGKNFKSLQSKERIKAHEAIAMLPCAIDRLSMQSWHAKYQSPRCALQTAVISIVRVNNSIARTVSS
jgi:hypothetical protein